MTKRDLPYTRRNISKGRVYWRFRSKETGDIRLPSEPGTPEFHRAYSEALAQRARIRSADNPKSEDSFAWLIDRYQKSAEFKALADPTQLDYSKTLVLLEDELGAQPYRYTTRAMLKAVRDDYAGTPRKANKIKQMLSRLYSWAQESDLVPDGFNPAAGLKRLKRKGGEREYVPWSDAEIDWAIAEAEPHELTPLLLLLYTGQRRTDIAQMTWQQWQGDFIRVRTSKTRELVDMPCHPRLKAHLEQLRTTAKVVSLTGQICLSARGRPYTPDALSGVIRRLAERVERIPSNRSAHGLRYAAAARMEQGGATVGQIESVLGQRTFRMALKYATARLRAAQGIAAMKGGE